MLSEFKKIFDTHDASQYNIKELNNDIETYFREYIENELNGKKLTIHQLASLICQKMSILQWAFYRGGYTFDGKYQSTGLLTAFSVDFLDGNTDISITYQPAYTLNYNRFKIQYREC